MRSLERLLINPRYCIADAINFDFLVVKKKTRKVPKTHRDEGEKGAERGHKGVRSHGIYRYYVMSGKSTVLRLMVIFSS